MKTLLVMIGIFIATLFVVNVIVLRTIGIPFSEVSPKALLALDGVFGFLILIIFIILTRK